MEPISGRCRECGSPIVLADLALHHTGACPSCGALIAPQHGTVLLDEARRVQRLARDLVASLQRLQSLPGALEVDPPSVVRALCGALGWDEVVTDERRALQAEADALRADVRVWRACPGPVRARQGPRLARRMRRLRQRLSLLADRCDAEAPVDVASLDAGALHKAADALALLEPRVAAADPTVPREVLGCLHDVGAALARLEGPPARMRHSGGRRKLAAARRSEQAAA